MRQSNQPWLLRVLEMVMTAVYSNELPAIILQLFPDIGAFHANPFAFSGYYNHRKDNVNTVPTTNAALIQPPGRRFQQFDGTGGGVTFSARKRCQIKSPKQMESTQSPLCPPAGSTGIPAARNP